MSLADAAGVDRLRRQGYRGQGHEESPVVTMMIDVGYGGVY